MNDHGKVECTDGEALRFIDEPADNDSSMQALPPWKIIIADDNEEIHSVTKLVLDEFSFKNRQLHFLHAYSGEETRQLIREHPDVAFILLDVVMETDDAGLEVVRYIRDELQNNIIQIILNTGQPGQAPEQEVISKYAINDYKSKTEFNSQKLLTSVTASLRAFELSHSLKQVNNELNEYKNHLEDLVKKRTTELEKANDKLGQELLERISAEKALQQNNELLEDILDASPIGICMIENRSIKWINDEMRKLFGFEYEADYKEKEINILYPSEEECRRVDSSAIESFGENISVVMDSAFTRKDGSEFPGNLRISGSNRSDPFEKSILTISDITWRRQAEYDRMQKERLQGALEMSGSICHELNQPLQYVSGSSELIIMDMTAEDPLYESIHKIREQVDRMGKITKKLMNITKYKTCEYAGGRRIIDLEKASSGG